MVNVLLLVACGEQPALYGTHSYTCCTENTGNLTWHAGQSLALHWQPTPPVRTTDPNPHQIVLSLSLTGPFGSVDALKQATSQGLKPTGVRTVDAAPMSVDDRTVLSPISQLDLAGGPATRLLQPRNAGGQRRRVVGWRRRGHCRPLRPRCLAPGPLL